MGGGGVHQRVGFGKPVHLNQELGFHAPRAFVLSAALAAAALAHNRVDFVEEDGRRRVVPKHTESH
jgi:hypothetical protein